MATKKPGQLIAFRGNVFRITKTKDPELPCKECELKNARFPCSISICDRLEIPYTCYLKLVK